MFCLICGSYRQKYDCIHYSATYIPICTKFGTEPVDDFMNNLLKFDVESMQVDRNMKQYVFFSQQKSLFGYNQQIFWSTKILLISFDNTDLEILCGKFEADST